MSKTDCFDESLKNAFDKVKPVETLCCGSCHFFSDEDIHGGGWCFFKMEVMECGSDACDKFTPRKESEAK